MNMHESNKNIYILLLLHSKLRPQNNLKKTAKNCVYAEFFINIDNSRGP